VLRKLVDERDPAYRPSASKLQASVRRLLIDAGLGVVEEYVITDAKGEFIARVDFRLVGEWVVIEVEGRANHSSKVDWEHDLTRRNRITAEGYAVIHATRDKVTDHPEEFLAEVRRAQASQARLRRDRGAGFGRRRSLVHFPSPDPAYGCRGHFVLSMIAMDSPKAKLPLRLPPQKSNSNSFANRLSL